MSTHPVPAAARTELERLGGRWHTLPFDRALRAAPALRAQAQRYAAELAGPGATAPTIADLGPAAAYDQLVVLTYEVSRCRDEAGRDALVAELAELRARVAELAAP